MLLPQNYSLKIICAIFTIVWTCTLLFPTHLNAQETSYKSQAASFKTQISNTKFQTTKSKLHSSHCLPETDNCSLQTANYHPPSTIDHDPSTFNLEHSKQKLRNSIFNIRHSKFEVSTSLITSTSNSLPFHLHTNRLGTVDPISTNFLNRIRATGDLYRSENFTLDYGADLALRISENSTVFFPELYAGAEYRAFRLEFGRFDRPIGLNNHDLSIGSMMVSRNAVPIPRIMLSTPDFTAVPWTNEILEFNAMYSHGWFTDDRFTDSPYLHQKYFYLKVNVAESVSMIGGIVHNAVWAGSHPTMGQAPRSFSDYLRIVFSQAADSESNVPGGEVTNALGNSVAAYEFALFYNHRNFDLKLTRLFYLEDSVSTRFRSPWDGVWGVNLIFHDGNSLLNAITYEHINTRRQDAKADEERGRSNYYNHPLLYRSGWSHYNRTIGIPLITRNQETDRVDNNVIVGHHFGLKGNVTDEFDYKFLATYSRNYGTLFPFYRVPRGTVNYAERREDRYSFLLEMSYSPKALQQITINVSTAIDLGEFRESSFGGMAGVSFSL